MADIMTDMFGVAAMSGETMQYINSIKATSSFIALFFIVHSGFASGPHDQLSNHQPVVRVLWDKGGGANNGEFEGTGTVIDVKRVNGDNWLCVLTADHVVSSNGTHNGATRNKPGIQFGNSAVDTGNSSYLQAGVVKRAGPTKKWDLTVLGINIGQLTFQKSKIELLDPVGGILDSFSLLGYGNEGRLNAAAGGYVSQGKYGKQRYMNSGIKQFIANQSLFGGYVNDVVEYEVVNPNLPTSPFGSGTPFDADSGSPYYLTDEKFDEDKEFFYRTDSIFAVHHGTSIDVDTPARTKVWAGNPSGASATLNYGVHLNATYHDWIKQQCAMVPEPTSMAALALGSLLALGRRRKA